MATSHSPIDPSARIQAKKQRSSLPRPATVKQYFKHLLRPLTSANACTGFLDCLQLGPRERLPGVRSASRGPGRAFQLDYLSKWEERLAGNPRTRTGEKKPGSPIHRSTFARSAIFVRIYLFWRFELQFGIGVPECARVLCPARPRIATASRVGFACSLACAPFALRTQHHGQRCP